MLTETSTENSLGFIQFLNNHKQMLVPKPGTLMSELHGSLQTGIGKLVQDLYNISAEEDTEISADFYLSLQPVSGGYHEGGEYIPSLHDSYMDNYISDLTHLIQSQVKFCREIVNRQLLAAKEEFQSQLELSDHISAEDCFDFHYCQMASLFLTDFFANELEKTRTDLEVEDADFDTITAGYFSDEENWQSLFLTKEDAEFDQYVTEFMSSIGFEQAKRIIIEYSDKAGAVNCPDVHTRLEQAMVNYLFYRRAYNDESNPKKKSRYLIILEYYLGQVSACFWAYQSLIKNKELLLRKPSAISTNAVFTEKIPVYIVEENWNEFTSEGGSVEMLLGALAARTNSNLKISDILENKDEYIRVWNASRAIFSATYINKVVADAKIYLKAVINNLLQDETTQEHFESANVSAEFKSRLVSNEVDKIQYEDLKDLNWVFINLVAGCVYSHTSAYDILSVMYELTENNEDITAQQAAHVSAIYYLVDFLTQQVELTTSS